MIVLKYDLIEAYNSGIKDHPSLDVEKRGMIIINFESCPIADCIFITVEKVEKELPNYITLTNRGIH